MTRLVVEPDAVRVEFDGGRTVTLPRARTDPVEKTVAQLRRFLVIDEVVVHRDTVRALSVRLASAATAPA